MDRKERSPVMRGKLAIARQLALDLRHEFGRNIRAIGLSGSVARGTAQKYSDIDMYVLVRRVPKNSYKARIINKTYCSLTFTKLESILDELAQASPHLPEILGGFTKTRALYDPDHLFKRIEEKASQVPERVFLQSAELALLYSYEDFCRIKNGYLSGDEIVLRDNAINITYSATLIVACLNHSGFKSDREMFQAYKRFRKLPRHFQRIEQLRYDGLKRDPLYRTALSFYIDLVDFAEKEGAHLPVERSAILDSNGRVKV